MGTETGDAAALKAKLDTLVKDAEEAEEKAVAARTLLEEEEQTTATLEKALSLLASLCQACLQAPSTHRCLRPPMRRPSSLVFTSRQRPSSTSAPS
jgi:predicted metal-binding protein